MITRVRIAPVEHWCENAKESSIRARFLPGKIVAIETESMVKANGCDGRFWYAPTEQTNRLRAEWGDAPVEDWDRRGFCEHMLEMD